MYTLRNEKIMKIKNSRMATPKEIAEMPPRDAKERFCEVVQRGLIDLGYVSNMVAHHMGNDEIIKMFDKEGINLKRLSGDDYEN